MEHGFLPRYQEVVTDLMGAAYPELVERTRDRQWVRAEEESFGRTLEQGTTAWTSSSRRGRGDEGVGADERSSCTTPTASRST